MDRREDTIQGWQPIETAPKDGRYVIVGKFSADPDRPVLGWVKHSRWLSAEEVCEVEGWGDPDCFAAGWSDGNDDSELCFPTHWQTLAPPNTSIGERDDG